MEEKQLMVKVGKGVFKSTIITIILLVLLAIIMVFKDVSNSFVSVYYIMVTCLSIVYGAIYAARKNNRKGWMVGLLVAFFYMLLLYLVSAVFFKNVQFSLGEVTRFAIAMAVGVLAGMLGINI